mgnify:FL=1
MKLKHTTVATLAATLLTFGSLAGGADAAVTIYVEGVPGSNVTAWTFSGSYSFFSFNGDQQIGQPNHYRGGAGGDWSGEIASDANLNNTDVVTEY